ncbi:Peptide-N4-(N-acetyl-beta-glucosaminyl)asparagine amidase A [Leucoagaricus sp. SymC.cos]|nr:Peptide-N4-(N-acetyl-beta-glucosaminyl)asparagine amidase A [Leucoagaricus sp. SymC.cos]
MPNNVQSKYYSNLEKRGFVDVWKGGDRTARVRTLLCPPTDCGEPGTWAAITLNFTVTSNGTQFDRLGIFTFQNVEIWRTSTPEPTRGDGIIWTYIKDVTRYTPLFAKPGTFILQLDNLIQDNLDGVYSTVLHATYYASSPRHPAAKQSDLIVPLSTLQNDTGNEASVPPGFSVSFTSESRSCQYSLISDLEIDVTLPQNTVEVYAELYASGNGNEEFWYFNVPDQFLADIPQGLALGQGPFREVRLLIDGQVAGVSLPYATIFTGGITPPCWRPITSYGAIDLPTYFLDVTPFVPLLVDGKAHNFTIDVVSAEADHTTLQNWFVSGNLQVFTDASGKPTTGKMLTVDTQPFPETKADGTLASNGDLRFTVTASRKIHIESEVISGSGKTSHITWTQDYQYSNAQQWLNNSLIQNLQQAATGSFSSSHGSKVALTDHFSYPLNINFTLLNENGTDWFSSFDHSYQRDLLPMPISTRSTINNRQLADGFFHLASTGNTGNGTNSNVFSYRDDAGNTYNRRVNAAFNNITLDVQSGNLAPAPAPSPFTVQEAPSTTFSDPRLPGDRSGGFKRSV